MIMYLSNRVFIDNMGYIYLPTVISDFPYGGGSVIYHFSDVWDCSCYVCLKCGLDS